MFEPPEESGFSRWINCFRMLTFCSHQNQPTGIEMDRKGLTETEIVGVIRKDLEITCWFVVLSRRRQGGSIRSESELFQAESCQDPSLQVGTNSDLATSLKTEAFMERSSEALLFHGEECFSGLFGNDNFGCVVTCFTIKYDYDSISMFAGIAVHICLDGGYTG
jgi:hypothetical protein